MRLLIEQENGSMVEVKEIEGVGDSSNMLIFFCSTYLKNEDYKRIETQLSESTGKRCIILPPYINKIVGV